MKRKCLAWVLLVAMLVGMFGSIPALAADKTTDYAISIVGTTNDAIGSSTTRSGLDMAFNITHNGDLSGVTKVVFVIDSTKLELINKNTGATLALQSSFGATVSRGGGKNVAWDINYATASSLYAMALNDTQTIFRFELTYSAGSGIADDSDKTTDECDFALGFKQKDDGTYYTAKDLDATSIMICDPEVGITKSQTTMAVVVNDKLTYSWGTIDTTPDSDKYHHYNEDLDTLAKPTIFIDGEDISTKVVVPALTGVTVAADKASSTVPTTGSDTITLTTTLTPTGAELSGSGTWNLYDGNTQSANKVTPNKVSIAAEGTGAKITVNAGALSRTETTKEVYAGYQDKTGGTIYFSDKITISRATETFTITASDVSVQTGNSKDLTATVKNQYGETVTDQTVTWTSGDTNIATINGNKVNGVKAGTTTLTAKCGTAEKTINVKVEDKAKDTVTITGTVDSKAYDGTTTYTGNTTFNTSVSGVTATVTGLAFPDKAVGSGKTMTYTSVTLSNENDYSVGTVTLTGSITAKELTVAAGDVTVTSKEYDGTTAAEVTIAAPTGVVAGDTVTVTGTGAFADANVGTGKTVNVTGLTLGGTDAGNYTLTTTTVTASGDITAKAATVTRKTEAAITGTTVANSDLLNADPADVDLSQLTVTKTFYEKSEDEDGNVTYTEVAEDALETGKTYYVDVAIDNAQTVGNYSVSPLAAAKTGTDMNDTDAENCVKLTCNAPASSGGYVAPTTKPQEEEPVVIDSFIKGYEDGTIHANSSITRAETAVIMARISKGFDKDATYSASAPDVPKNADTAWYYTHVSYDIQKGIINGYPDGNFYPDAEITRAEFAAMLARYMGLDTTGTASFDDVNTEEYAWASGYVAALEKIGVVNGYEGSNDFKPGAPISRAEAIKMVVVALGLDTETAAQNTTVTIPSDLSSSHWAYKYIMAALTNDVKDIAR